MLSEDTFDPAKQHHKETIFTIGNGYLSTRGAFEEGYPNDRRATFIHGVFDDAPIVVTELANAPDWLSLHVLLDGEKFSLATGAILAYRRELDLQSGVLRREVRWRSPQGRVATLIFTRFASLADEHLLALRCEIIPEFDGQVELRAAINGQMDNEGLLHWRPLAQGQLADGAVFLRTRTRKSGIEVALAMGLLGDATQTAFWDVENVPTLQQVYPAQAGQPIVVTKFVGIATSRDAADPLELAHRRVQAATDWESALAAQRQAWAREWERCHVVIEGDDEADLAVRFSIFQLLIAAPAATTGSTSAPKPSLALAIAAMPSGTPKSLCCRSSPTPHRRSRAICSTTATSPCPLPAPKPAPPATKARGTLGRAPIPVMR